MESNTNSVEICTRQASACCECQRRKQKCSREWPCDHCRSRKVSHLCHFGSRASSSEQPSASAKRRASDAVLEEKYFVAENEFAEAGANLIAWGYMPDKDHFNINGNGSMSVTRSTAYTGDPYVEEVAAAILMLPPRYITDLLVQNFLHHVNYFYYTVYPPQFLDEYAQWWLSRMEGKTLSPVFTCLLLRVCSYSAQFLSDITRRRIEIELGETINVLSERYHKAAEKLSRCFPPGKGGLMQVQQLFLTATYYKSEIKFVDSWHALNSAIREAQEIGLHKDSLAKKSSEFDMEMRRRLWCLLYLWDRQASSWLGRPLLIQHRSCAIEIPMLRVEESDQRPGLPSPFTPIKLQYQLVYQLSEFFLSSPEKATHTSILLDDIQAWIDTFPRVFSVENPDTHWDQEYPYVPFQRAHLHAMAYMFKLNPLKPYLTKDISKGVPEAERIFRIAGIDTCLTMMKIAKRLFDIMYPSNAKAYIVTCVYFDTAAVMCSAVMHDHRFTLHRRPEVIDAIEEAWHTLQQLNGLTKTGTISCGILNSLIRSLPLLPTEEDRCTLRSSTKRRKKSSVSTASSHDGSTGSRSGSASSEIIPIIEPVAMYPTSMPAYETDAMTQWDFNTKDPFAYPTVADFTNSNFEGLEEIWDWQYLNLAVAGQSADAALFQVSNGFDPSSFW